MIAAGIGAPRAGATFLCAALVAAGGACRPAARESESVRFWAMGREGEVVEELVQDFERENPGVRVRVQQIPWSAAHEKLLTAYVGGAMPDLSQLGNTWISEFVALHALEPLSPWLARSTEVREPGYFPGIWDTNVIDGTLYGVPWYVDTRVLFYRRDLLARAGFDSMPATWEGWRAAMRAAKRVAGKDNFAVFLPVNEWPPLMILGLQAGSPLLADGGTRGAFSGPEFRRALGFYVDLFREGLAPPISNTEIANLYQEFARGLFSMYISGPWNLGEFARRLPPELAGAWSTAPLPGPDGPGLSMAGGSSLVVYKSSRAKAAAWRLVEFLSRPQQQARFYRLSGDLPARREAWADSALQAEPRARAFEEQLGRVAPWPKVPEWEQITTLVLDHTERAVRGSTPPDSALATLDREVDRVLEKRRWMVARQRRSARVSQAAPGAAGVAP